MATPKLIADFDTQLSTAISVGTASFSLAASVDDDGVTIPNGFYYFTVDNSYSNKEYFSGNLTVSGGIASVTGVKSVSRQGVETTGAVRSHRVGASVLLTDWAAYKAYMDSISLAGTTNATQSSQGVVELATTSEINAGTATGSTGAGLGVTPDQLITSNYFNFLPTSGQKDALAGTSGTPSSTNRYVVEASGIKFGGSGSDGPFASSTGNTNIDLAGASLVVKNYTSFALTGNATMTFSNPASGGTTVIFKSQGNVTLTSSATPMIDARNLGATGGAGGIVNGSGSAGSDGTTYTFYKSNKGNPGNATNGGGGGGSFTAGSASGGGATGGAVATTGYPGTGFVFNGTTEKYSVMTVGAGGGGGGGGVGGAGLGGGAGGRGGGSLIFECRGAWNFTTTNGISVAGTNGSDAPSNGGGTNGGGGGGGGAGNLLALYNTLTANTGSVTVTGGAGGVGGASNGGTGATGISSITQNVDYV